MSLPYQDLARHILGLDKIKELEHDIHRPVVLATWDMKLRNLFHDPKCTGLGVITDFDPLIEKYVFKPHFPRFPFMMKFRDGDESLAIQLAMIRSGFKRFVTGEKVQNFALIDDYYRSDTANVITLEKGEFFYGHGVVSEKLRLIEFDDYFTPLEQYAGYHTGKKFGL